MARGRPRTEKTDPTGTHLTTFLDLGIKVEWDNYCKHLDLNSSQLLRRLIKEELTHKRWECLNTLTPKNLTNFENP